LQAQSNLQFQNFSQKDGLASDYVLSFFEDQQGFIWIGSEGGLNRFDGKHFLKFSSNPEDISSLDDNWVTKIFEDSQKNLWLGTRSGLNRLDKNTGKITRIPLMKGNEQVKNLITDIFEDPNGNIWILIPGAGLFFIPDEKKNLDEPANYFSYNDINGRPVTGERLINIPYATSEFLWIVHSTGIDCLHVPTRKAVQYLVPSDSPLNNFETDLVEGRYDGNGKIYFGQLKELYELDTRVDNPSLRSIYPKDLDIVISKGIVFTNKDNLIFASFKSLFSFDLNDKSVFELKDEKKNDEDLFSNSILTVFKDKQGKIWVGTAGGGMYIGQPDNSPFVFYEHDRNDPNSISPGPVRSVLEDETGKLWISIYNQGIDIIGKRDSGFLKREKSYFNSENSPGSLSSDHIVKMLQGENETIWLATNLEGLIQIDKFGKTLTQFIHNPKDTNTISGNRIWGLEMDKNGFIWIGTWHDGINRIDPKTGKVKRYQNNPDDPNSLGNNNIRSLYFDSRGKLWVGTTRGLGMLDPETQKFTHYRAIENNPNALSEGLVWAIFEDHKGQIWVGTNIGLNRLDKETNTFTHYFDKDGLPDNAIYGILEDDEGNLWVSTRNGLARYQGNDKFLPIGFPNGLEMVSFLPKSYLNSKNSKELFFGGGKGLLVVNPERLENSQGEAHFVLHSVSKSGRYNETGNFDTDYFISEKDKILQLGYDDQSIVFSIADLNKLSNNYFQYEYKLEGFNQHWIPLLDEMQITFTNLPPGQYQLQARAKNLNNEYTNTFNLLTIIMSPPWWKTWMAYLFYILIFVLVLSWYVRSHLKRQLDKKEAENLRALDEFKNNLFANITHEFRTPLTIISGMMDQIRKKPERWLDEGSEMVQKNTHNLLNLVNQILELQKLEAGKLEPNWQQGDIVPFLQSIFEQFKAFGQSKEQKLTFFAEEPSIVMDFDAEKTLRVISNILSNAIKYTPDKGKIDCVVSLENGLEPQSAKKLIIKIQDTGQGISEEHLPFIFNRFFRASNQHNSSEGGTGIGLSLSQEMVKLLGGNITVSSVEGSGTTFRVSLPITHTAPITHNANILNIQQSIFTRQTLVLEKNASNGDLPIALIVEDNQDIAQYLHICLEGSYHTEWANNGRNGLEKAFESIPDIIISDVMMPEMNGFELCEKLKEDTRTSHVPIILLTAKADVGSRITGLKYGADDYLAKPFHEEELLARMENLLDIRRKLQARYRDFREPVSVGPIEVEVQKEDEFIQSVKALVEAEIDNPEFDLNAISDALHLSRSQFGRKINALTGRTPAIFVRSIRLQKARELLLSTERSVKEIGYEVGFSNPVHFSRSYSEEYGESPSKTRENR
jgi:signal transduction histidine kinase/ligand-binding sensor domain-containing protein/DNA-binding response OmpR family regulator